MMLSIVSSLVVHHCLDEVPEAGVHGEGGAVERHPHAEQYTTFFKKNQDNGDIFKKLIHRLSDMSVPDLEKIDLLIDIIFIPNQETEQLKRESTYREETLDDTLKEAKNQLYKEQLEKNLERFRKNSQ